MNILIVDDIQVNRKLLRVNLVAEGYKTFESENGMKAFEFLGQEKIDLIISDILMPVMDGYRLCYEIRNSPKFCDIPIILLSATFTSLTDEKLSLEFGADKYIPKPVSREILIREIHQIIEDRKQQKPKATTPIKEFEVMKEYSERLVTKLKEKIVEMENTLEELKQSEEKFRQITENIREVFWMTDVAKNTMIYVSPAYEEIWGSPVSNLYASPKSWLEAIHSNDRDRILQASVSKQVKGEYDEIYRIVRPDGSTRWIREKAYPIQDDTGKVYRVVGVAEDISENKKYQEEIQRQLQRITALRNIDMAIASSMDLKVTLNIFLDQVMQQLHVDAADILVMNPHTNILEYGVNRGFRTNALQQTHLRMGEGFAGKTALDRKNHYIPDLQKEENCFVNSPLFKEEGFVSYYSVPLIAKGLVKGTLELYHRKLLVSDPEWVDYLNVLAGQAAIAIDSAELFNNLQHSNIDLSMAYDTTLEGWSKALDLRDKETEGHTLRVTDITLRLAKEMRIDEKELIHIRRGALLHDIGKMGIPDNILLKPGALSPEEWFIMKKHPVYAYDLLYPITYLRPALDIPYSHHEKWDGSGYPRGLKGEQIPQAARIFAIIDVWDALRSDRPYRKAWDKEKTLEHIKSGSGTHFDPNVVEAFLNLDSI